MFCCFQELHRPPLPWMYKNWRPVRQWIISSMLRIPTSFGVCNIVEVRNFSNSPLISQYDNAPVSSSKPDLIEFYCSDKTACRNPHTNIGDSEVPGGMKTYCSPAGRYSPDQGQLPPDFWSNVEFKSGTSSRGARFAQRTCPAFPELANG